MQNATDLGCILSNRRLRIYATYILEDFENASPYFFTFLQTVYDIEKLLPGFNVQPRIGMNQSLFYHATPLMTSHGYIQHPAPFCTVK